MASDGTSNTGVFAIVAILLIGLVSGFVAYQARLSGDHAYALDVNAIPK